jgi:hypothetical protein
MHVIVTAPPLAPHVFEGFRGRRLHASQASAEQKGVNPPLGENLGRQAPFAEIQTAGEHILDPHLYEDRIVFTRLHSDIFADFPVKAETVLQLPSPMIHPTVRPGGEELAHLTNRLGSSRSLLFMDSNKMLILTLSLNKGETVTGLSVGLSQLQDSSKWRNHVYRATLSHDTGLIRRHSLCSR